jgi:REP element-mobilizing transposase RayT
MTGFPPPAAANGKHCCKSRTTDNGGIRLEDYLDRGHGRCWLRERAIARLAGEALRYFDQQRYGLQAWVIMPNHVHVLVQIWQTPLASVLQSWKRFIAREANQLLHREGSFWEREYRDTYMRNEEQAAKALRYIEENPVKVRLVSEAKLWPWSSARFRGSDGRLPEESTR